MRLHVVRIVRATVGPVDVAAARAPRQGEQAIGSSVLKGDGVARARQGRVHHVRPKARTRCSLHWVRGTLFPTEASAHGTWDEGSHGAGWA